MVAFIPGLWHILGLFEGTSTEMIRNDCVYFQGEKPCVFKLPCRDSCPRFKPFMDNVLIIKCRAMGDVLRTTAILPGLKRKYPKSHITWLVDEESVEILSNNPYIDRIIPFRFEDILPLLVEKYDCLICLDKEAGPTSLASKIISRKKFGFGMNKYGKLDVFNKAAEYAFRLGIDDDLKFRRNKKTYQRIVYEAAELEYRKDRYVFELKEESREKARKFFAKHKITGDRLAIGLNTGAGTKFETKLWPRDHFLRLIHLLSTKLKARIFLLGSKKEEEVNHYLAKNAKDRVVDAGSDNSVLEFAGFLSFMDVIVSSDSSACIWRWLSGKMSWLFSAPPRRRKSSSTDRGSSYAPACPVLRATRRPVTITNAWRTSLRIRFFRRSKNSLRLP
jgi:heptosyltransferase-2